MRLYCETQTNPDWSHPDVRLCIHIGDVVRVDWHILVDGEDEMNTQSEALRLAYWMDDMPSVIPGNDSNEWHKAAAELRRLHAVNTELLEALKDMLDGHEDACTGYGEGAADKARAAIARATG